MSNVKIGQSIKRFEDQRFLTGRGRYVDDINLENQTRGVVVRSPYAHATIKSIDTSMAMDMDGVLLVVTRDDWQREGFKPIPTNSGVKENKDGTPLKQSDRHCLAIDRVRYVGEAVALVVTETLAQAEAAAEAVEVDYDELPAVVDPIKALQPGAPQLWDDIPNNLCLDFELGDKDGTEKAFAEADHVVSLDVVNNRVTAAPIETRGCVAAYDASADHYTLYNATQNAHANRDTFANVLNLDKSKLDQIAPDVGGGFGAKNSGYPEPPLCLYAAKRLGRHFIGIERDPEYLEVARERLEAITTASTEALSVTQSKRAQPRIPFGALVERGLVKPGDTLYCPKGRFTARVRADGTLIAGDRAGSIHQVGAALEGAPSCNGWTYWHTKMDGKMVPIDVFRQQIRAEMKA